MSRLDEAWNCYVTAFYRWDQVRLEWLMSPDKPSNIRNLNMAKDARDAALWNYFAAYDQDQQERFGD